MKRINVLEQEAREYRSKRDLVVTIAIAAVLLLLGFLCSCKTQYIAGQDTEHYRRLPDWQKDAFNRLHDDFFYRRHAVSSVAFICLSLYYFALNLLHKLL